MIGKLFLVDALLQLNKQKQLTETAIDQVTDNQLFDSLDSENNSIAIIIKHIAGNSWKSLSVPKGMSKEYEVARNGIKYKPEN